MSDEPHKPQLLIVPAAEVAPPQQLFFAEAGQTAFFAGEDSDQARRYAAHTGTTAERRGEIIETALEMVLQGHSQRQVAHLMRLSRNTLAVLMRRWEQEGRLEPLKQRISARLGRAIEAGVEAWTDALEAGAVPVQTIPVAVGIFTDKKALLDGEATVRIEHARQEPSLEDVAAYIKALPGCSTSETVSDAKGGKPA